MCQLLEEEVVETHKNLLDNMEHWLQQDASLLAVTNEVDYDQDGEFSNYRLNFNENISQLMPNIWRR